MRGTQHNRYPKVWYSTEQRRACPHNRGAVAQCRSVVALIRRAYSLTIRSSTGIQLYLLLSLLYCSSSHWQIRVKNNVCPTIRLLRRSFALPRRRGTEHFSYNFYTCSDPFIHLLGSSINLILCLNIFHWKSKQKSNGF